MSTIQQYDSVVQKCEDLFLKKTADYGTAWRVLRTVSVVDQIFIKAYRVRTVQEAGEQKIDEDISCEFVGIVNYAVIGLIQLSLTEEDEEELDTAEVKRHYEDRISEAKALMQQKNHDYGEAWRQMCDESFVDLILMKLQRMKQIISNKGRTLVSEGLAANYYDIANYAVFALILMDEKAPLAV